MVNLWYSAQIHNLIYFTASFETLVKSHLREHSYFAFGAIISVILAKQMVFCCPGRVDAIGARDRLTLHLTRFLRANGR